MANFFDQFLNSNENQRDIFTLLRATPIFHQLTQRELRRIESILHERTYLPNEIIFEEGEEGLGLYVVRTGQVFLSHTEGGQEKEIATLSRGSFFGELALLDGSPRSAQARAIEKTELIGFFRPDLVRLCQTDPMIAAKLSFELARWIGKRLRETLDKTSSPTSIQIS